MAWQPLRETSALDARGTSVSLPSDTTLWRNDDYVVHRREIPHDEDPEVPPMFHLSIRNDDRSAKHDWRDFQRIKNQLAGLEYEGVEIYPPESIKVDTANQYHLFCFPSSIGIRFSETRMVTNQETTSLSEPGAKQRNNEDVDGSLNSLDEINAWKKLHASTEEG